MIGLLSFHQCHNFGAVLQSYALQHYITGKGYESEYINFDNENFEWHGKKADHIAYRNSEQIRSDNFNDIFSDIAMQLDSRWKKYETFIKKYIYMSEKVENEKAAASLLGKYSSIIVGGDQLWNSNIPVACDIYSVPYNIDIPISSYGTSMGDSKIIPIRKLMFLQKFSLIGVREKASMAYLAKYTKVPVFHTVDPVFLLSKEEWNKIIKPAAGYDDYIFAYVFNNGTSDFWENINNIKRLGDKWKKNVVICSNDIIIQEGIISLIDISPEQWLGLIAGAEFVITNSFHGAAFSCIFQKQFLVLNVDNRKHELLEICGLLYKEEETIESCMGTETVKEIDYNRVNECLDNHILKSKEYLDKICAMEKIYGAGKAEGDK